MHFGRKDKDDSAEGESTALQAAVDRLNALPVEDLAVELMAKAFTGQPGPEEDEPPWPELYGWAPSAYDVANWLYLPRNEELDASRPLGRALYGLVSEALQALEHASLVRATLDFGFQGAAAYAHTRYALTRRGIAIRDAGAVEQALRGG